MHCREGLIQGDPLDMVSYGLGVIPLIKPPEKPHPDFTQTQYYDNTGTLGTFGNIDDYFNYQTQAGPEQGYYPKTKKSTDCPSG